MSTVIVADKFSSEAIKQLQDAGIKVVYDPKFDGESLSSALAREQPQVLVVRSTKVQRPQLEAGQPALKLVVRAGSGYDTIDTKLAKELGISVSNCPGMNSTAVAELVFAHILNQDRRIEENVQLFRSGRWAKGGFTGKGLKGSRIGIVGFGYIGQLICARALAFEMDVLAYDPILDEAKIKDKGAKYTNNIMDIAKSCDFITLHVPGGKNTEKLINKDFLSAMKSGAVLINTSRATVIDEAALIEAAKKPDGIFACVDVMSGEPSFKEGDFKHPFAECKRIYVTHHIGASTVQAEEAIGEEALRVVLKYVQQGEVLHRVNE